MTGQSCVEKLPMGALEPGAEHVNMLGRTLAQPHIPADPCPSTMHIDCMDILPHDEHGEESIEERRLSTRDAILHIALVSKQSALVKQTVCC